jgi:hypothetical protein
MGISVREMRVRKFVDDVWNGRHYEAAAYLYGESYANEFGTGPSAPERSHTSLPPDVSGSPNADR